MKIIQDIQITGKNWNDIASLPCVETIAIRNVSTPNVVLSVEAMRLHDVPLLEVKPHDRSRGYDYNEDIQDVLKRLRTAYVDDTIVEFEDHTFGIVRSGNSKLY